MAGLTDTHPFNIDLTLWKPSVRKDKHDNAVSEVLFPDFTYSVVHHPAKTWKRDSANVYKGRDQFVRYSAHYTESDREEDSATILTRIGEFSTSWGDGDNLGLTYPEILNDNSKVMEVINEVKRKLPYYHDKEEAFLLLTMWIIHTTDTAGTYAPGYLWMDKAFWENKKAELEAQRRARPFGVRR